MQTVGHGGGGGQGRELDPTGREPVQDRAIKLAQADSAERMAYEARGPRPTSLREHPNRVSRDRAKVVRSFRVAQAAAVHEGKLERQHGIDASGCTLSLLLQ